jgi:hypothetical protein
MYGERYPDRNHHSACTFENMCRKLLEAGSWKSKLRERSKPVTNEANEVAVPAAVANNPHARTRQLLRGSGISRTSVTRILHRQRFTRTIYHFTKSYVEIISTAVWNFVSLTSSVHLLKRCVY